MSTTIPADARAGTMRRRDLLQGILDTSVSAILVAGAEDGRFYYANDRAADVLGVSTADLLARRFDDPAWQATDSAGLPLASDRFPFAVVRHTGEPVTDFAMTIRDATGQRRELVVNAARLPGSADVVISVLDVTQQRAAERDLAAAAARLKRIMHINPAGLYALRLDPDDRQAPPVTSMISRGILAISGMPLESVQPDPLSAWRTALHPDDATVVEERQADLYDRGFIEHEYRILRPDGEVVWISDHAVVLYDDHGAPAEIIGAWLDISERHAMEDELRRSNEELQQFAYVASHDLQEPLRMVSAYLGLLKRRYEGQLDEEADEFIGYAVDGAQRMHRMINDLLAYSRVGRATAPTTRVKAAMAVNTALANLKTAIADAGATVRIEGPALPEVWVDTSQLTRLFQNLIGNALKYRRPDVPPVIVISATRERHHWHITLADNGIGIAPQDQERVFQIFQRLHHNPDADGTGIGLSICKRVVERHGGRIWVESKVGEGSAFHITLPVENRQRPGYRHSK